MMKFALSLLLFFSLPVFSQAPVEPVRVMITAPDDKEFAGHVRAELRKTRYVVIASESVRPDYRIFLASAHIAECDSFTAAMLVVDGRDPRGAPHLSIHTGRSLESLARLLAERLEREYFTKRRHAPKD